MATLAFGRFRLIDARGESLGDVIIAPEYVMLQRGTGAPIHDVSYLALWSADRIQRVGRELNALATSGPGAIAHHTPELQALLHAIAPSATAIFVGGGGCGRAFARRRLKAELASAVRTLGAA